MEVVIRRFQPADQEAVVEVWAKSLTQAVQEAPALIATLIQWGADTQKEFARREDGDMHDIRKSWCRESAQMFVATERDKVVGCVAVKVGTRASDNDSSLDTISIAPPKGVLSALDDPDSCSVWRLAVDEPVRRVGIGTALMDEAERWCLEKGRRKMQLMSANPAAQRFFQRLHYQPLGMGRAIGAWYEKPLVVPEATEASDGRTPAPKGRPTFAGWSGRF